MVCLLCIHVIQGTLTGQHYVDEVTCMSCQPIRQAVGNNFLFQQDNAPIPAIWHCLTPSQNMWQLRVKHHDYKSKSAAALLKRQYGSISQNNIWFFLTLIVQPYPKNCSFSNLLVFVNQNIIKTSVQFSTSETERVKSIQPCEII